MAWSRMDLEEVDLGNGLRGIRGSIKFWMYFKGNLNNY